MSSQLSRSSSATSGDAAISAAFQSQARFWSAGFENWGSGLRALGLGFRVPGEDYGLSGS